MESFETAAQHWDNNYAEKMWSGKVNETVVDQVRGLTPGRSLDIGSGEGADVIWLASQGWDALGVDISATAVQRAREAAAEAQVEAEFLVAELPQEFPAGTFDLVTLTFFHSRAELDRAGVFARAQRAVAPGGVLLVISHSPHEHHLELNTLEEEKALLMLDDAWRLLTEVTVPREDVRHGNVNDIVLKVQRIG